MLEPKPTSWALLESFLLGSKRVGCIEAVVQSVNTHTTGTISAGMLGFR